MYEAPSDSVLDPPNAGSRYTYYLPSVGKVLIVGKTAVEANNDSYEFDTYWLQELSDE